MSFFIKPKQHNKILNSQSSKFKRKKREPKLVPEKRKHNEVLSSDDEIAEHDATNELTASEDETETAQDKKIRLAKTYLEEIKREEERRLEDKTDSVDSVNGDFVNKRLKEDYLKQSGKWKSSVADKFTGIDLDNVSVLKCRDHRKTVTCLCISSDTKYVYSGSKDGGIVKWSVTDAKRVNSLPYRKDSTNEVKCHKKGVLSIAISSDDQFLAVGDESKDVQIWNPQDLKHVHTLKGHQAAVTGLTFKQDSHVLYSCSKDRSVKIWSLDEMAYVETLFGHQDGIADIDCLAKERCVTAGSRDTTLRLWKITEESQLIFNGHSGSIDVVRFINEENFVSGGDDGQLCVWSILKKKPLCSMKEAHGRNPINSQPYWISAVASLRNTDLVASGSQNGFIRLWKLSEAFRNIALCMEFPLVGFVNALVFSGDGSKIVAAIGQEHKFGRWEVVKCAKNSVVIMPLLKSD